MRFFSIWSDAFSRMYNTHRGHIKRKAQTGIDTETRNEEEKNDSAKTNYLGKIGLEKEAI